MSDSISGAIGAAVSLQNMAAMQQKDSLLLRKVLDNQADTINQLISGVPSAPQLASTGAVGTQLHVTA